MKKKFLCIGEAVIDRIYERGKSINDNENEYKDYIGGAPANIAIALSKLGISSSFVGSIGNDNGLKNFSKAFSAHNIDSSFLQIDYDSPTRIVEIERTKEGERVFKSFANNKNNKFADLELKKQQIKEIWEEINYEINGLVLGSIPLSNETSRDACIWLLEKANKLDIPIIFDINWRSVFWPKFLDSNNNPNQIAKSFINDAISKAKLLKVSKEEALIFFNTFSPEEISNLFRGNLDVIITNGGNEIHWFISNIKGSNPIPFKKDVVDTTGAGDAFLSGMIYQLLKNNNFKSFNDIFKKIKFASICGYLTCLKEGAIDPQPLLKEVKLFQEKT